MKAQMLVDMDGVLADVYSQFINFEYMGFRHPVEPGRDVRENGGGGFSFFRQACAKFRFFQDGTSYG